MPFTSTSLPFSSRARRGATVIVAAFLASSVAGCGTSENGIAVSGNVSYGGEAITSGTVTFFPTTGRPIVAAITDGTYEAALMPGEYSVIVMLSAEVPEGYKEGDPLPPPKIQLPLEYASRMKSPLKATVKEGHSEPIDFELK